MTEAVKVGYLIGTDQRDRLQEMADNDYRTYSAMIEWLIDREWDRRQHMTVDSGVAYTTKES